MELLKKIMMATAILLGVCSTVSAQEEDIFSFTVKYQGQRPTITDFVTAFLQQEELGEVWGNVSDQWKLYRQGKKTSGTFTVDQKNGFIEYKRIINDAEGRSELVTEFCYWNMSDNRHKLLAVNNYFSENGKYYFTEHSGPSLLLFDSQTRRMSFATIGDYGLEYAPFGDTSVIFNLPRQGKNIKLVFPPTEEKPNRETTYSEYVWDGKMFHIPSVEEAMPNGAKADMYDVSLRIVDEQGPKPGYECIVRLAGIGGGKTLQVLEARIEDRPDLMDDFGKVIETDVNFDGIRDLLICLGAQKVSDQSFMHYDAWIAKPTNGADESSIQFVRYKNFRGIANAEVDHVNKRILSHYLIRDGVSYNYSAHRWRENGMLMEDGPSWVEKKKLLVK